jgi:hypothetical protein
MPNNNNNSLYVRGSNGIYRYKNEFKLKNNSHPFPMAHRMEALKKAGLKNSIKSKNIVVKNNNNNNNNPVKQALDNKINKDFDGKKYDLIVHFKGFNQLFDYGVYNGEETDNKTHEIMKNHIQKIAVEYMQEIKNNLDNKIEGKTLLLVWDGDDLKETQWTQVMKATAKRLVEHGAKIEFLCCYDPKTPENQWGVVDPTDTLIGLKYENNHIYKYADLGVNDFNEVGMVLLYVTSNLIKKNNKPILVLCAGGGDTPVNEYEFTRKDIDKLTDINHPLAMKLFNSMNQDNFKWMASSLIKSRKNKNKTNGVEQSGIKALLDKHQQGGARKKRTIKKKSSKKKKSLKKKSKKNKSKSKRKC